MLYYQIGGLITLQIKGEMYMKKHFKRLKFYISLIVIIFLSISISFYFRSASKETLTMINNKLYSSSLPEEDFNATYVPKISFADMPVQQEDGITLNILNKNNYENIHTLLKSNRYYFPLSTVSNSLGYTIEKLDDSIILHKDSTEILLSSTDFTKDSKKTVLRGDLLTYDNEEYIALSDIENIFDLISVFDFASKNITLLNNDIHVSASLKNFTTDKIAMLRFEDFTSGDTNTIDKNLLKIKCMANLLYSNSIKFHVAWIPRFVAPTSDIDNDLLTNSSIQNVGFVNILDYLISKGGEIGLHGYTHQSGDERSAVGEDLSTKVNDTVDSAKEVIENGIDTASALNIPVDFFESPHYRDSKLQQNVINQYFKYVYEPYNNSKHNLFSPNNTNLYIPTPIGFVSDPNDISSIENGLNNTDPEVLHSFFYHPSIELDFIAYTIDNDKLNVYYDRSSPLQKIVKLLNSNNYTTIHVTDMNK